MPKARYRVKRNPVTQPSDTSYRYIPLTRNQIAIVDTEDFEELNEFNWHAHWSDDAKTFYAVRTPLVWEECPREEISMHREIIGCLDGEEADHIDGDGLNNRRQNLRKCTHAQNTKNKQIRSGKQFIGIQKRGRKWMFEVMHDGKRTTGFGFITPEDAARARDAVAIKVHGEFASLNHKVT